MYSRCVFLTALAVVFVVSGPQLGATNEDMTTVCPYPCSQGGHHYCHPIPCPLPPCADPVKDKGACCPHCPTGPNCLIKNQIVPEGQNITTNGQWCTCRTGGDSNSALVICTRCFDLNIGGVGKRCI